METKLLARKNGEMAIVLIVQEHRTYITMRHIGESRNFKVFVAEQGINWIIASDVDVATDWILAQQEPKKEKIRKVRYDSPLWRKREKEVLDTYAPQIVACSNCGSPRHKSYVCLYCEKE